MHIQVCIPVCLSVCLSVCVSVCLCVCVSACRSLLLALCAHDIQVSVSVCVSLCLFFRLSVSPPSIVCMVACSCLIWFSVSNLLQKGYSLYIYRVMQLLLTAVYCTCVTVTRFQGASVLQPQILLVSFRRVFLCVQGIGRYALTVQQGLCSF